MTKGESGLTRLKPFVAEDLRGAKTLDVGNLSAKAQSAKFGRGK
jgi:hypothetical protein